MSLRNLLLVAWLAGSGVLAETFELTLEPGWNLVSVPIAPDNPSPATVFQGVDARIVWRYDAEAGMYAVADRLEPGQGYWVHVGPPDGRGGRSTATVNGTPVRAATLPLRQGWHLVGPVGFAPYAALPAPLQIGPGSGVDGEVVGWADGVYRRLAELPAGAAAWMYSDGDGEVRLSPNPTFAGPLMAYSPEVGQARVHWPEAVDDRTAPEAMVYRVYAAPTGHSELVDVANLAATVVGETFALLDGLLPGETYRVTVVAEDEEGNRNYSRDGGRRHPVDPGDAGALEHPQRFEQRLGEETWRLRAYVLLRGRRRAGGAGGIRRLQGGAGTVRRGGRRCRIGSQGVQDIGFRL